MVLWGAVWGAVLGLLWPGYGDEWRWMLGAVLGAIGGVTLRGAVRSEIRRQAALVATAPAAAMPREAAAPPVAPVPVVEPEAPVSAAAAAIAQADFADTSPAPPPSAASTPAAPRAPAAPSLPEVLVGRARDWLLGGNTIVRLGLLVLFVGLAFLAKYAVENALLPPQVRLAAIGAAGIGLFAAGWRMLGRADRRGYALSLQGAGVGVLYLTVFASFRMYQFLPAGAAFAALALVCAFSAVIAIAQNAQAMAVIGFAGGFAAPLLVSTGQGSHVGLFSYYLVLGLAITGIAWARAWRPLNLLGFFATFGVATAWGVLRYRAEDFASTEPFLVAFFLLYVAAAVLYATRHSLSPQRAVDGTLVFGVPLVAFGLQAALVRELPLGSALSALAAGAFYLGLTAAMAARARRGDEAARWLGECFVALGLGFVTLAVPLALDARWTSATWAVEGAAVYWLGRRQGRWLPCAAGLALQAFAAIAYLTDTGTAASPWPFANPAFLGALMLAASALMLAWWTRERRTGGQGLHAVVHDAEAVLSPVLLWAGFLWWYFALHSEITRAPLDPQGLPAALFGEGARLNLSLLAWVGSAFALQWLAGPSRSRPWPQAAWPAMTVLPVLLAGALYGAANLDHLFVAGGWLAWPVLLALHAWMLRRLDRGTPAGWWRAVHAAGVWLLVLLAGNVLVFAVGQAQLWRTAWASVVLLVASTAAVMVLAHPAFHRGTAARWPLDRFARSYGWVAAAPLAAALAIGALVVAVRSDGNARPLPYIPLINPTDLAVALALSACAAWLLQLRRGTLAVPAEMKGPRVLLVLAAIAFVGINTVWLRVAHHYADVPWSAGRLFDSFLVQAGYSILWTVLALGVMVAAFRRGSRGAWTAGAVLLAVTVAKLFLIDLSNRGGSERIVVFIAVGVLMLVLGWFAPLPPARPRNLEATA
ncbi:DUF2339 domain-containing protein [Ramlibacter humi]|uniref:DUF2339 domain-containing protein n=1 Tax=Ramlibacter humi TaxID=2530451 RepID=A0A4Z0BX19_9BURK|nr:DUF2339 domain-containing protein [Ramlibacter humi]TFZ03783.1 DUF2339 domain-containing protein [Ramlibacter humi]